MVGFWDTPFWNCHSVWSLKICIPPLRYLFFWKPTQGHCAVYTSPTSVFDRFLESLGQDLINTAYIGLISGVILTPTPINRVNNAISNTYRLTYNCHTILETFRVNKSFSNNIRQTYKCYIFLDTSGQGLPIK